MFLDKTKRVSITLGALLALGGAIIGGTGATVTFKAQAESKIAEHERSLGDHETRLRGLEKETVDRMGRIETKVDELLRRAK